MSWAPNPDERRIVCSAILYSHKKDGTSIKLMAPRHDQIHALFAELGLGEHYEEEVQGFVDQWNVFFDREDSLAIAQRSGQLEGREKSGNPHSSELFSEDLY